MEVGHLRAEEDDDEPERRGTQHQSVRFVPRLEARRGGTVRGAGPQTHHHQGGEEQHGVGEVDDHQPRRQEKLDGRGAQKHLDHQQHGSEDGRVSEGGLGSVTPPADQGHGEHE